MPESSCGESARRSVAVARHSVALAGRLLHTRVVTMHIRPFELADEAAVIDLWDRCGLLRSWNDPAKDIRRKLTVQPGLFLVAVSDRAVVGSVMAGYDGHRGWVNYLAVDPDLRRRGVGRDLMQAAENALKDLGCPKLNLQVRRGNALATAFYAEIGYTEDAAVSLGKRLVADD